MAQIFRIQISHLDWPKLSFKHTGLENDLEKRKTGTEIFQRSKYIIWHVRKYLLHQSRHLYSGPPTSTVDRPLRRRES